MILLKRILLLLVVYGQLPAASSQSTYWQQQVNYTIDVSLNDKDHSIDGFEKIEYTNHSPDTLRFIWFHIWPNAYKHDKTAFSDQLLENGNTKFYFSDKEEKGYINRLDFKVNGLTAEASDHPQHIDIVKLILPSALAPGEKAIITTPFHVKLPFNFSRGGHDGQSYQLTQWFPKPAVYDQQGWHPMPYLDQGEFYSEFGNFDVSITVPENYVVAATGELQNEDEKEWLKTRKNFTWEPTKQKVKTKGGGIKTVTQKFPASATRSKTLHFKQDRIHDFAWFADKRFIVLQDTCQLPSGKIITAYSYYTDQPLLWSKTIGFSKQAIRTRSEWIGEYPFNVVSVVQGPESFGGGMEYPTITLISPEDDENLLHYTIAHEIGHNWFYGMLASNERAHPWMDEGLNTYYDNRYSQYLYGNKGEMKLASQSVSIQQLERILFETKVAENKDQPINTSGEQFTHLDYNLVAYYKTAAWLEYLEAQLGKVVFDKAMKAYYEKWQFKHPQPEDFKAVMTGVSGQSLDSSFSLLDKKGILPGQERKGIRAGFLFSPKFHADYLRNPSASAILYTPAIGFNSYDKLMAGVLLTNLTLPPPRFQFLLAPMYATASKKFAGTGFASYSLFPKQLFHKIDIGVSGARFTINEFTDPDDNQLFFGFHKIVPGIRLTLKEKNPRSTVERYLQFKTFMISEEGLRFYRDSIFTGTDTTVIDRYGKNKANRTLNQLKLVIENYRALYPYKAELKIEQGRDFVRAAFTGNYFFNYAKEGGLRVRFFAGKLFYTSSKTINKQYETDRYFLNMTGANGYEDYTYSDYFAGRNEFEGFASQQIMERDGAFKVRTDLLAAKVGRTDDWLMATNFSSTIPSHLNPLSFLPFDIPLKVFADLGTYAEAWKRNANTDRFLFDAGVQVALFRETINIYIPLLYSKPFKDYLLSTTEKKERFGKKVSFSIDISNFSFRKLNRNFSF